MPKKIAKEFYIKQTIELNEQLTNSNVQAEILKGQVADLNEQIIKLTQERDALLKYKKLIH